MEIKRKNINRGFTKLRVWKDAIQLLKFVFKTTQNVPYELSKTRNNILDASHSISRNISEGYCRRNLKEYLNFLNIALGSSGELFSGMVSFKEINNISEEKFEEFDKLHFQVENELIGLIKLLPCIIKKITLGRQQKQKEGNWQDRF